MNQKENFALGQVERQIGMNIDNELETLLMKQDVLSILRKEQQQNSTVDYEVSS